MADNEIIANAASFRIGLGLTIIANYSGISGHSVSRLDDAYARLTVLQAWRVLVLEENISAEAMGFYSEAQNDGLISSTLISIGMWRPAMKSLRSLIENILHCFYFKDHPVE